MKNCDWMEKDRTCLWDNVKEKCELLDKNGKCTFEPNKYMYCSCGFKCNTMSELRNHRTSGCPMKKCTKCDKIKPITGFYKNCKSPDGYSTICKECRNAYEKERRKIPEVHDKKLKKQAEILEDIKNNMD